MKIRTGLFLIPALFGMLLSGCNTNKAQSNNSTTEQSFDSATFNDESYVYDGLAHQLSEVSGAPVGTSITYEGRDGQTNVGEYLATATLTKEGYKTKTLSATLSIIPATFNNVTFTDQSVEYNGLEHTLICSNVPSFATVIYQNNKGTNVGTYNATATISAPNYNDLTLNATLTITKGNIKGVTFNNSSYTYDGNEHSITINGDLPAGVTVSYENNKRTDAGSQQATATISGEGYNTLVLHATLTINKAIFTGITFTDLSVQYDGNTHTILASEVPSFADVVYENNSAKEGGTYNATATISAPNYETLVLHATLIITLKQITGIAFEDATFVYDGYQHNIAVTGTLPDGITIYYEGNGKADVGVYTVTATMVGTGYETLVLTATLTIQAKTITGVTFEDTTFDYDGNEHQLLISGTLPEGVTATYSNNTRTNEGSQTATVTLSGEGYETLILTARLSIVNPYEDELNCSSEQNILVSTENYSSGSNTLLTDKAMEIEFAYHDAKAGEDGNWLTLNTGGYIYNVTPVESFTDLDLVFKDGYEQFRVYYSYGSPTFDTTHYKDYTASKSGYKTPDIIYERQPTYFKIENIDEREITLEEIWAYLDTSIVLPSLTVTSNNSSYGTVTGGSKYKAGDKVTVNAYPTSSTYVFDCWKSNDQIVSLNAEYTFTMPNADLALEGVFVTKSQHEWDLSHGVRPTIDMTNKTATYGMYPKTHVNKQSIINDLNDISEPETNGWYLYENEYYAKVVATPYHWASAPSYAPEFDDGMEVYEGETHWFKVEPIEWSIRRTPQLDGYYYLLSKYLIDVHAFNSSRESHIVEGETIYANNYEHSDIRNYLNGEFYSQAFSLDASCILDITVNNAKSTTNNSSGTYYCSNTIDKVFLPSYRELTVYDYGFGNDETRRAKTTDYTRAIGVCYMIENDDETYFKFNAEYWTRSPDNSIYGGSSLVTAVQQGGFIGNLANEYVNEASMAVRPAIALNPLI